MSKHIIEFDHKCKSCNGTGLYVGMGERDGAAVVCRGCNGTGKAHTKYEYEDFEKRIEHTGVKRVFVTNPGIGIGKGRTDDGRELSLSDFGGMNYKDWLSGKGFPPKSEMREFTCPAWWYQSADYSKKPNWRECELGSFSQCSHFPNKQLCWERWDKEYKGKK